ncbi:MAG: hypothetical protein R3E68_06825 [Burkholderiaceae bacterium]
MTKQSSISPGDGHENRLNQMYLWSTSRGSAGRGACFDDKPVSKVQEADRVMLSQASRLANGRTRHDIRADKVAKMREAIEKGEQA